MDDYRIVDPKIDCKLVPITLNNYHLVRDFRETGRIFEYRDKLGHKEIGFFAEHNGKMIGSIWATINKTASSKVVKTYMRLMPNAGLIHDIVTSEEYRRKRIGQFMVSHIASVLLNKYALSRIIIDVNLKNNASLQMMDRVGVKANHKAINVSALGRLILHIKSR